jgi:hypothetical protein
VVRGVPVLRPRVVSSQMPGGPTPRRSAATIAAFSPRRTIPRGAPERATR